jgi:hypothetical protein
MTSEMTDDPCEGCSRLTNIPCAVCYFHTKESLEEKVWILMEMEK